MARVDNDRQMGKHLAGGHGRDVAPLVGRAGGLARLDWSVPEGTDAVLIELGANDMLSGGSEDDLVDGDVNGVNDYRWVLAEVKSKRFNFFQSSAILLDASLSG